MSKPEMPAKSRTHSATSDASTAALSEVLKRDAKDVAESSEERQRVRHRPETRAQMLERLTNPLISLHEASVLLRVCPATVRRYSDSGELMHVRTEGGQRRFRLRDVLMLMRQMEARSRKRY